MRDYKYTILLVCLALAIMVFVFWYSDYKEDQGCEWVSHYYKGRGHWECP